MIVNAGRSGRAGAVATPARSHSACQRASIACGSKRGGSSAALRRLPSSG